MSRPVCAVATLGVFPVDVLRNYIEGQREGVEALLVGGAVRDHVMGLQFGDQDVEVYGASYKDLVCWLDQATLDLPELKVKSVSTVGKAFGVVKVSCALGDFDFSIPRRESRNAGVGHCAFDVSFDPKITREEAAARRDFTMNSLFMDTNGEVHDPFGGTEDIKRNRLSATSEAYKEDPLRVLRGMQFASRFDMLMNEQTRKWSCEMRDGYEHLSVERVWHEWRKWALGNTPSAGLDVLLMTGWIDLYPELQRLLGCHQDRDWHPEGDVWIHTCHVCDAMAENCDLAIDTEEDRLVLMFAALLHDVGKPMVTFEGGDPPRWRSPGHAKEGVPLAEDFLSSIGAPRWLIDRVLPLVKEHMVHVGSEPTERVVRRLATRLEPSNITMLRRIVWADMAGRPPLPREDPLESWLEIAERVEVTDSRPVKILMGRHLLVAGIEPGPLMGKILKDAYEAQLDGEFETPAQGVAWVNSRLEEYFR